MNDAMPLVQAMAAYVRRSPPRARWHTPGHKGRVPVHGEFLDWAYDVTEVEDLAPGSQSQSPLAEAQVAMARVFGADRTWFSVQGASLGMMAGILAAVPFGGEVVVERNAHRSVLAALVLGGLSPRWIYPPVLAGGVVLPASPPSPDDLVGAGAVVVTRPTYDGLCGSLKETIERAHNAGLPVIVDEAHGTHFAGRRGYPASAVTLGADLIVHGAHKTEAVLTQAGLLHRVGSRVEDAAIERWWSLLGTSSPSYLLMASLDRYGWERNQETERSGWEALALANRALWKRLRRAGVPVLQDWWEARGEYADPAKLTIMGPGARLAGELAELGAVEKYDSASVTLILAPGQSTVDLERLLIRVAQTREGTALGATQPWPRTTMELTPRDALARPRRRVAWKDAKGEVAAVAVTPYPPGIPLVMPGERITEELTEWVSWWRPERRGYIEGLDEDKELSTWVVE